MKLKEFILKEHPEAIEANENELRINAVDEEDDNTHASIYLDKEFYQNHRSGIRGNVYKVFGEYSKPKLTNTQMFFKVHKGVINPIESKPKNNFYNFKDFLDNLKKEIYSFKNAIENPLPRINHEALNYLLDRGLSKKVIRYKLGFILNGYYEWRIFIPFIENGKIVTFTTRDFSGEKKNKYKHAYKGNISHYVFNYDLITPEKDLFIFEGVFDALMLEDQVGTSSNKSELSKIQIKKIIIKNPKRIVFVPDNDKVGRAGLIKNINNFKKYSNRKFFVYDNFKEKDFGETKKHFIPEEEIEEYDETVARSKLFFLGLTNK